MINVAKNTKRVYLKFITISQTSVHSLWYLNSTASLINEITSKYSKLFLSLAFKIEI